MNAGIRKSLIIGLGLGLPVLGVLALGVLALGVLAMTLQRCPSPHQIGIELAEIAMAERKHPSAPSRQLRIRAEIRFDEARFALPYRIGWYATRSATLGWGPGR